MKVALYPAISLDGFIARKDGDSDWVTEEDEVMFEEEAKKAGCIIVGRKTFKQYEGEIYPIEGVKTYIVTSTPQAFEQSDSICYVPANAQKIRDMIAADGFTNALLAGGGETNGLFAQASMIDLVIVSIYPLVLGGGIRMLGSYEPRFKLRLTSSKLLGSGIVQNRYEVVR